MKCVSLPDNIMSTYSPRLCSRNVWASRQVTRLTSLCPNHISPYVIVMKENRDGPFYKRPIVSVSCELECTANPTPWKCYTKLQTLTLLCDCVCSHVLIYKLLRITFLTLTVAQIVHNSIIYMWLSFFVLLYYTCWHNMFRCAEDVREWEPVTEAKELHSSGLKD